MKLSKRLAAAVMSVGLLAGGITGVTALDDATTPSAEAATACIMAYKDFRGGGYAQNIKCAPFVVYHETRSVGKSKKTYYANKAYIGSTSSFWTCYAYTLWSGWYRGR